MPLRFPGPMFTSASFEKVLEARDGKKAVPVITSVEAIQDIGLERIKKRARDKYDAGKVEKNGSVRVTEKDFQK